MVVIFDGFCGLCNKSVDWLLRLDKNKNLKFTPIQGEFVKTLDIPKIHIKSPSSIVVWYKGKVFYRSQAFFEITKKLPFPWKLLNLFSFIPNRISDRIYNWVAKNRYSWFGKSYSCRIPSPNEKDRFLD
ncbi:MAG: thiol-disulfide oxidoreductase DCC family protein [Salibacteraceae bacterium]